MTERKATPTLRSWIAKRNRPNDLKAPLMSLVTAASGHNKPRLRRAIDQAKSILRADNAYLLARSELIISALSTEIPDDDIQADIVRSKLILCALEL